MSILGWLVSLTLPRFVSRITRLPAANVLLMSQILKSPTFDQDSKSSPIVLLAVSEREESTFFGANTIEARLPAAVSLRKIRTQSADDLAKAVEVYQPTIIVGAWSTPQLPLPGGCPPAELYVHICGSVSKQVSEAHFKAGLKVTNWGTTISAEVAECALLLTIAALRRLPEHLHGR